MAKLTIEAKSDLALTSFCVVASSNLSLVVCMSTCETFFMFIVHISHGKLKLHHISQLLFLFNFSSCFFHSLIVFFFHLLQALERHVLF